MKTETTPAFYALGGAGGWREYVNLLHLPYTVWHLSYVVLGAAIAPTIHLDRLLITLAAFFLAVGISSHALDELNGRPLGTRIPKPVLLALGLIPLLIAVSLGIGASLMGAMSILPFVVFGGFIVVAYTLGLWKERFHSDFWFAFAWGAFPVLASYWINSPAFHPSVVLLAAGCLILSLAQRTLSTQVRTIRRQAVGVEGAMELRNGKRVVLDGPALLAAPERALGLLSLAVPVLAVGVLTYRL